MTNSSCGMAMLTIIFLRKNICYFCSLISSYGTLVRAFSKNAGVGLTIEVEILALLECLKQLRVYQTFW